ncbi:MAG: hypothetical protein IGR76_01720 [Synechococcales cyanobacterium T60_A2020_003]|nr:hypothetical protein [Synechococcales cyanobacterium T60_A2020_003]
MTGFIRNLFGSKKSPVDTRDAVTKAVKSQKPTRDGGAYFLDPDSAKTLGNIDYMRTPKKIKHTFPKGKVEGVYEAEISATDMRSGSAPQASSLSNPLFDDTAREPSQSVSSATPVGERRKADSSMDMFRNMAKDIKKK